MNDCLPAQVRRPAARGCLPAQCPPFKSGFIFFPKKSNFPLNNNPIMITSTLSQLHWYKIISPNFEKAIEFVLSTDFTTLETGKYSVDGENVLAIVNEYTTKPAAECDPESHRDYADIQIMITGTERFGYAPLTDQETSTPYSQENDVAFYSLPEDHLSYITLRSGEFIIFFPTDIHQPEVFLHQPELVRKVVMKVALQPMANFSETSVE
jgi:biofilm protein TabA